MKIKNINTEIWVDNQIMRNPEIVSCRDDDSNLDLTREISFKLFKDDLQGNRVAHKFYVRASLIEEFKLSFHGHHKTTDTSSNRMSAYTDGDLDDDGVLIVKNLVTHILSGGNLDGIDIVDYGYADYVDVQNYFTKNAGEIIFAPLPKPLLVIAQEVILSNIHFDGKTAKELGFSFDV